MTSTTASRFWTNHWPRGAAVAGCVLLAACAGAGGTSKTGDTQPKKLITLRLAAVENEGVPYAPHIKEFARAVEAESDGSLKIEIQWDAGNPFDGQSEKRVADQVRNGDVDLALVPSRAWDLLGVTSMEALQVPLLVDGSDLLQAIAKAPVANEMMAGLTSIGVKPLALWPDSLRHPVGFNQQLTSATDMRGVRLRSPSSRVTDVMATALGYEPIPPGRDDAEYEGAESGFVWASDLSAFGTFTGNVTLAAKANTLVANAQSFEALSDSTRQLLEKAAGDTTAFVASTSKPEQQLAVDYCTLGGHVAMATEEQLAEWRNLTAPVAADIERDTASKHIVDEITAMKQSTPANRDRQAAACGRESAAPGGEPSAATSFPDGVYRADSPREGIVTFSMKGGTWQKIRADGGLDCEASYVVTDGRIVMTMSANPALACGTTANAKFLDASWTLEGDQLRFTDINSGPGATVEFSLPWTKIE